MTFKSIETVYLHKAAKKEGGLLPLLTKTLSLLSFLCFLLCCLLLFGYLLLLFLGNLLLSLLLSFLFCRHSYLLLCDYNHYLIFVKTLVDV